MIACTLVGLIWNIPVALVENWLVYTYETDGLVDK
eukprot:COSAG01_NODE_229_length_21089_cov_575.019194_10_plen_35_part_00